MNNESILRYLEACQYAIVTLGSDAERYFSRLHKLAAINSTEDLHAMVRGWRPNEVQPAAVTPAPVPSQTTNNQPWTPCKHYGGERLCERCKAEQTATGLRYAGAMKLADAMYEKYRPFVRKRIHAELNPYTGGKAYPGFDDLELECWQAVAARIEKYIDHATPMAWLKVIIRGTVADHFKRTLAAKRGADKTVPLDFDPPNEPLPAKPKRPAGTKPDESVDDLKALWSVSGVNRSRK